MSFLNELRKAQNQDKADEEAIGKFNSNVKKLASDYAKSRNISEEDATNKVISFIKQAGEYEGKLSGDSSEIDVANYGSGFLSELGIDDYYMGFNDYIRKYGSPEQKKAFETLEKRESKARTESDSDKAKRVGRKLGIPIGLAISGQMPAALATLPFLGSIGLTASGGAALGWNAGSESHIGDKNAKKLDDAYGTYEEAVKLAGDDIFDILDNSEKALSRLSSKKKSTGTGTDTDNKSESLSPIEAAGKVGQAANDAANSLVNGGDTVTFTLPRANDPNYRGFGAKLQELGLTTDKGLWGSGGDVEFYTKQLYDQGALDSRGNLKIGVPITLRRRR